jgi:lysophospholipase L1-like esterase
MAAMDARPYPPTPPVRRRTPALFWLTYLAFLALLFEGAARVWSAAAPGVARWRASHAGRPAPASAEELEATGRRLGLDPYEMADPDRPGRWRLRPRYRATVSQLLEAKRRDGKVLTARRIEEEAPRLGLRPDDVAVEVNSAGYRGPVLAPDGSRARILTLGDSCTFGSPFAQEFVYARALERELQARGFDAEVVNGGVEGYAPDDVLARIDEFRALRPALTTIYIGWNALYTERWLQEHVGLRRHSAAVRLVGRAVDMARARWGGRQAAIAAYERPKRPDRETAILRLAGEYAPSFLPDVVRIADEMRASGSQVVLITLPGLYSSDRSPSPRALEIGHLPIFTDNPFVLARMAERYNDELRSLAHERSLALVDLDAWCRRELRPTEDHFVDAVHLDERSQSRVGVYLAKALAPLLSHGAVGSSGVTD